MHVPAGRLTGRRRRLQYAPSVLVILEDGLPPVTPIHHMIDFPRILNAHLSSHAPRWLPSSLRRQKNNTISIAPLQTAPREIPQPGNDAGQWRAAPDLRMQTDTLSARPLHQSG